MLGAGKHTQDSGYLAFSSLIHPQELDDPGEEPLPFMLGLILQKEKVTFPNVLAMNPLTKEGSPCISWSHPSIRAFPGFSCRALVH